MRMNTIVIKGFVKGGRMHRPDVVREIAFAGECDLESEFKSVSVEFAFPSSWAGKEFDFDEDAVIGKPVAGRMGIAGGYPRQGKAGGYLRNQFGGRILEMLT
jgi:hypothetical protein